MEVWLVILLVILALLLVGGIIGVLVWYFTKPSQTPQTPQNNQNPQNPQNNQNPQNPQNNQTTTGNVNTIPRNNFVRADLREKNLENLYSRINQIRLERSGQKRYMKQWLFGNERNGTLQPITRDPALETLAKIRLQAKTDNPSVALPPIRQGQSTGCTKGTLPIQAINSQYELPEAYLNDNFCRQCGDIVRLLDDKTKKIGCAYITTGENVCYMCITDNMPAQIQCCGSNLYSDSNTTFS